MNTNLERDKQKLPLLSCMAFISLINASFPLGLLCPLIISQNSSLFYPADYIVALQKALIIFHLKNYFYSLSVETRCLLLFLLKGLYFNQFTT